jgi:threonine dehydratase
MARSARCGAHIPGCGRNGDRRRICTEVPQAKHRGHLRAAEGRARDDAVLSAGRVVDAGAPSTIADGVAGRYVIPEVLDDLIAVADDAVLVSEDSIKDAMRLLYEHSGLIVEPAAALGVASILEDPDRFAGKTVATILCGSNASPKDFEDWVMRKAS